MRTLFKIFLAIIILTVLLLSLNYFYGYTTYFNTYSKIEYSLTDLREVFDEDSCEKKRQDLEATTITSKTGVSRLDTAKVSEVIDYCYYQQAIRYVDDSFCEKMSFDKEYCIEKVNRYKDLEACLNFTKTINYKGQRESEEKSCYLNYAFYTDNPEICEEAKDSDNCYYLLAFRKNVYSGICDKINNVETKNNCYFIGALISKTPSLCAKMNYMIDFKAETFPYEKIALKDICFYYFAHDQGKLSFCDKIELGRLRRNCKLSLYL